MLLIGVPSACGGGGPDAAKTGKEGKSDRDDRPPLVRTEGLKDMKVRREVRTTGYLEAEHTLMVRPEVTGKILEIEVDEGAQVVANKTILATLDVREATAAWKQLDLQAKAAVVDLRSRKLAVSSAQRELQRANIELQKAAAELKRNQNIAKGIISGKILDEARFAWETAGEAVQVAEFNEQTANLDVERAENTIEELDEKLKEAQLRVERHTIRAPRNGFVSKRFVTNGEIVGSTTDLFEVIDPSELIAYLSQPQRNLKLVNKAEEVEFETDAYPDKIFVAKVEQTSVGVDRETGNFTLRMRVQQKDVAQLRPGMFFEARILATELKDAWMVPKRALLNDGELSIVFAVRNGKVHEFPIEVGIDRGDWIECLNFESSGLTEKDVLVVSGNDDLRDQQEVRTPKTEAESSPTDDNATAAGR